MDSRASMGNSTGKDTDLNAVGGEKGGALDDAAAHMFEAGGLSSRLELSFRCSNLLNMDSGSQDLSDPMVVAYLASGPRWVEVGRTEVIANSLNPVFVRKLIVLYKFEEIQNLRFDVYDVDTSFRNDKPEGVDLAKQDLQGSVQCTLAEIAGSAGRTLTRPLQNPKGRSQGTLTVAAEEPVNDKSSMRLKVRGENFPASCKPFLRFCRTKELPGGALDKTPVYRSEVVMQFQSPRTPSWNQLEAALSTLCQGDYFRPIVVEAYDWKKNGKHKLLGEVRTSADELLRAGPGKRLNFTGFSGVLLVEVVQLLSNPSFLDYIRGGCELSFIVAIDFTASNGNPMDPSSLHHIDPYGRTLNQYQAAITFVGEVLQFYDTDKRFPVYGFGAQVRQGASVLPVSHCFAVNGNPANPEVEGIQGIMQAYQMCMQGVNLAGPTVFSHVLNQAGRIAHQSHGKPNEQKYFVLLIITDGVINDFDATVNEIIRASSLPLSVLIVGVGNADFTNMHVLDGDDVRLRNASGAAARDMVQLVALRDFITPQGVDRGGFTKALLEELPRQITSYFALHQIAPLPPPAPGAFPPVPPP